MRGIYDIKGEIVERIRREEITARRAYAYFIGRKRQALFEEALAVLQSKGRIRAYLPTGDLTFPDLMQDIDFYVIVVDGRYRVYPISVTGPYWVEEHRKRHPKRIIIGIEADEKVSLVEEKILGVIGAG